MRELIIESSDLIHEVIYRVSNNVDDVKFPLQKISLYLKENGYVLSNRESNRKMYVLYKDENKAILTESFISFVVLEEKLREPYRQIFYKHLISRSKIFYESAVHNINASKINLIQNQRRPCLSNMYYALHNSFSSLIETYRTEFVVDKDLEINFGDEEETKINHFVPRSLKVFIDNIDTILEDEADNFLTHDFMKVGPAEVYENPFSWIIPVFSKHLESESFKKVLFSMKDSLNIINLNNLGVDTASRRSTFEKNLKLSLEEIEKNLDILNTPKEIYLTLAAFFSYGYMLRQSADYDSLFEVKVPYQEIINWTIVTSKLLEFISESYFQDENENVDLESLRIQRLKAKSSIEILKNHEIDYQNNLMTITGIIIDKNFDFTAVVKSLYASKRYNMMNQTGIISELTASTENVTLYKKLFGTTFECYISLSTQGIFRVDVNIDQSLLQFNNTPKVNYYFLEELIHQEIIKQDLLFVTSKEANIVTGLPNIAENTSLTYKDLIWGVTEGNQARISSKINMYLRNTNKTISTPELLVSSKIQLRGREDFLIRVPIKNLLFEYRNRDETHRLITEGHINKILFVYFYFHPEVSSDIEYELEKSLNEEYPTAKIYIELIQLNDGEIRKLIEEDYSYLDMKLKLLIENFENSFNQKVLINELIAPESQVDLFEDTLEI